MPSPSQPDLISEERGEYNITPEQQAEKEAYRERLRLFLEDPASRQIEGFPIGDNEAILALSDPPYYTACPNPFLGEIIEKWQKEREEIQASLPDAEQEISSRAFCRGCIGRQERPDLQRPLVPHQGAAQSHHALYPALHRTGRHRFRWILRHWHDRRGCSTVRGSAKQLKAWGTLWTKKARF